MKKKNQKPKLTEAKARSTVEAEVSLPTTDLQNILKSFGNTRAYWCEHCGAHIIDGHKESCIVIQTAIRLFGKEWILKNLQVKEWDNYMKDSWRLN